MPRPRSTRSVWIALLGIPPITALIAAAIVFPGARRADENWDGLMLSPGDLRILGAVFVGWIVGLLLVFAWLRMTRPAPTPK